MVKKLFLISIFISAIAFGQLTTKEYHLFANQADSLYKIKQYKNAAFAYSKAFATFEGKGLLTDRYVAACSWAMAHYPDSAFYNLTRLATKAYYANYDHIVADTCLKSLHNDVRWATLLKTVKATKDKLNYKLIALIDSTNAEDQKWRKLTTRLMNNEADSIKYPKQVIFRNAFRSDSLNYYICKKIIDQYGYPNYEMVGQVTSHNFWLLIQHQDRHVSFQDSALKLLKIEVDKEQASGSDYAYLFDRVKINSKQLQVYGTQMMLNKEGTSFEPQPVIEPEKLDERRKSVGLSPEENYIRIMNTNYHGSLKK